MIVDDSPDFVHITRRILSHHGYRIEVAENGEAALRKYSSTTPDLVTLDLGMTGINGYETLKRILKIDRAAKVIIATAAPFVTLEECLKIGAVGLIKKPFSSDELMRKIEHALNRSPLVGLPAPQIKSS